MEVSAIFDNQIFFSHAYSVHKYNVKFKFQNVRSYMTLSKLTGGTI